MGGREEGSNEQNKVLHHRLSSKSWRQMSLDCSENNPGPPYSYKFIKKIFGCVQGSEERLEDRGYVTSLGSKEVDKCRPFFDLV